MKIEKLYIELSSLCNLHCTTCFRNSWFDELPSLMDDVTLDAVLSAVRGDRVASIFLGGMGEPTMHPRILEVLETARTYGKPASLITNGYFLDEDFCRRLAAAELDTLWLSVDGFSAESYEAIRRGSLYRKILKAIAFYNAHRTKGKLGITFVVTEENHTELAHLPAFMEEHRIDLCNISHVVPSSPLPRDACLYELPFRVGKMTRFDPDERYQKELDTCPFIQDGAVFVRSDGGVSPCMQLLHNSDTYLYEERRRIYAHTFGNLKETPLSAIYESPAYTDFRARVKDFAFPCCTLCFGCEDRLSNTADCMYNEGPTCGACLWAQGYIRCP